MDGVIYDLCVVGAGMFGSAAARHASANVGVKVCLIGPREPTADEKPKREIFGAYYDEGRITRTLDPDVTCEILSRESINRYRKLEELSGINFYHPFGLLYVLKQKSEGLQKVLVSANAINLPIVDLSYDDICKRRFPYIKLEKDDYPLLDDFGAGHISPRNMVAAQKKVAKNQGCDIIDKVVKEVKPLKNSVHEIVTEDNEIIKAKRVLICTGAFTNFKKFPFPKLQISIKKSVAVLVKLSKEEVEKLSAMPSLIYSGGKLGAYFLPPIKYPDGNYYIKAGHDSPTDESDYVTTLEEIKAWYLSNGDPKRIENLKKLLKDLLPDLKIEETCPVTCVTSYSPSTFPYIDRVTPTVTVAAIANGRGAKFSDEVGRIAATLSLTGKWDSELPKTNFQVMFEN